MGPNNAINAYEEARNQRMEENRRRMEELKLTALSQGFSQACNSGSKSSSKRHSKPRTLKRDGITVAVRRSSRVANLPPADYREVTLEIPGLGRKSYGSRSLLPRTYASDIARSEAIEAAAKIEKDLGSGHPSFLKPMLQSHVSGGFWLGLPTHFCSIHMPKKDERFILEDENGEESDTLFLSGKTGLSAGWRGFSIDHGLADGDCLVFQMVEPKRFKVFIVRAAAFESETTSEELLGKREDLHTESVDKELSAKGISDQKKRKRSSMAEVETVKPKAKNGKKVTKEKGKTVNVVLKSETMVESKKSKSKVKSGKKAEKKSEEWEGQILKSKSKDDLKSEEESKSHMSKAKDCKSLLKRSGGTHNDIHVSEKQHDSQKSERMAKNNMSKTEQISRAAAETMFKSGNKSNLKLSNIMRVRKTGIHTHLKTLEAPAQIIVVE